MNVLDDLNKSLANVKAEEKRLESELTKVRAVRSALEAGIRAEGGQVQLKAEAGGLKNAILEALASSKAAMSNKELRTALERKGYAFSLTPLHVSKTLTRLMRAKKVKRVGAGNKSKYTGVRK